jgi:hypothetical protein
MGNQLCCKVALIFYLSQTLFCVYTDLYVFNVYDFSIESFTQTSKQPTKLYLLIL